MVFFRPGYQVYLDKILALDPKTIEKTKVEQVRKWITKKRLLRAKGTVRAGVRSAVLLTYMRMKKALISMVLMHRTVGRTLKIARDNIIRREQEREAMARAKDMEFQSALKAKDQLAKIEEEKRKMQEKIEKEAKNVQAIQEEKQKAQKQAALFLEQLNKAQKAMADLEIKNAQELAQVKQKAEAAARNSVELEEERARFRSKISELEHQVNREKESNKVLQERQKSLEGERAVQLSQLSEAKKTEIALNGLQRELEGLKKDLEQSKKEYQTLRETNNKLQDDHTAEVRAKRDAEEKVSDLTRKKQQLEGEIQSQQKLIAQGREAQLNLDTTSAQLAALKENFEKQSNARKSAEGEGEELKRGKSQLENEISNLQSQNKELQHNLDNTKSQLTTARETIERTTKNLKDLERDTQETIDDLKRRLQIGRAVQQECRDRSRMPSSA
eukprot:TRINITY_DN11332_c0_g2_i3.p1 TRINITY_DN11332_c0_g2~~TRINITY_DN11332_c0_g2_i3.p1  ORF type:complete len:517 (-),score=112.37 TRINITY_DN11332_c0_g2_i3:27-1358(-)